MNTEDSEFKRIEAEAKRRAARDEDDDTQTYTSESAASYSYRCGYEAGAVAEREACAKLCDALAVHPEYASKVTKLAAMAIRARGQA